ncbi:hypothetical protein ACVSRU_26785, partial [Klebsiella pneumoniae]
KRAYCLKTQPATGETYPKSDLFNKAHKTLSVSWSHYLISLCCNCHKQIHLGKGFEDMLRKIYAERKDVLKKAGIEILLEDLILFYKMEDN